MPASTLLAIATRACIRNLPNINDIGDLRYELVRPILRKIDNPQQLEEIENSCPHIADADAELWQSFLLRDTTTWAIDRIEPSNPRSWHKVYKKILRKEQKATEAQEKELKLKIMNISEQRENDKTEFTHRVQVPPSEAGKQRRLNGGQLNPHYRGFGATSMLPADPRAGQGKKLLDSIRRAGSSRPKPAMTVKQREAVQAQARSQIQEAPQSMIREKQRRAEQAATVYIRPPGSATAKRSSMFAPRGTTSSTTNRVIDEVADRKKEQRLRNLTSVPAAHSTSTRPQTGVRGPETQPAPTPRPTPRPSNASPTTISTVSPRPVKRQITGTQVLLPSKRRKV